MSISEKIFALSAVGEYDFIINNLESLMKTIKDSKYSLNDKEILTVSSFYSAFMHRGFIDKYLNLQRSHDDLQNDFLFFMFMKNANKWTQEYTEKYLGNITTMVQLRDIVRDDMVNEEDDIYGNMRSFLQKIHGSIEFRIKIFQHGIPEGVINDVQISPERALKTSKLLKEIHSRRKICRRRLTDQVQENKKIKGLSMNS